MARIGIRCDCDYSVGLGHLAHQLLVAKELEQIGHEISFYIESGELLWREDLKIRCISELKREDLLIVDLLHFDNFPRFFKKKVVVHCWPDRQFFDADLVFAPNALQQKTWYNGMSNYCVGPGYKIMEPEISGIKKEFGKIDKILIMTSGADLVNIPLRVLNAIGSFVGDIMIKVPPHFNGRFVADLKKIRPDVIIKPFDGPVYHCYEWADVLITTSGNTLLEAAASGLPCMTISVTEIQDKLARFMETVGFSIHLGMFGCDFDSSIINFGLDLFGSVSQRITRSAIGRSIFDGKGLERCVKKIHALVS